MTQSKAVDPAQRNADAVRRIYTEAINERRLELLNELVAEDYAGPRGERGPQGFAATLRALLAGIPDLRFELQDVVASPEAVAVRWRWSGRHSGTLFNLAPSDKQVENSGIAIYYFKAGKITRSRVETDRLGLLQQIGVVSESLGAPRVVQ